MIQAIKSETLNQLSKRLRLAAWSAFVIFSLMIWCQGQSATAANNLIGCKNPVCTSCIPTKVAHMFHLSEHQGHSFFEDDDPDKVLCSPPASGNPFLNPLLISKCDAPSEDNFIADYAGESNPAFAIHLDDRSVNAALLLAASTESILLRQIRILNL